VVGALDRGGHVLGTGGLLDADRVVAGQAGQPPGEKRLEGEVSAVLLADDDDQRPAVDPLTAVPRPAVVCRRTSDGSPRPIA
jgi:hypothetical protein